MFTERDKIERTAYYRDLPLSIKHDYEVRVAMLEALQLDQAAVAEITKELASSEQQPIFAVGLKAPVRVPSVTVNDVGSHNQELRQFAFDAYDALLGCFGGDNWQSWHILPYYSLGSDTNEVLNLGVFAEKFNQTVVE